MHWDKPDWCALCNVDKTRFSTPIPQRNYNHSLMPAVGSAGAVPGPEGRCAPVLGLIAWPGFACGVGLGGATVCPPVVCWPATIRPSWSALATGLVLLGTAGVAGTGLCTTAAG